MEEILNDRFVKFNDKGKNIVFDISTNRVLVVENDNTEELESVLKIITQYNDAVNRQVLEDRKYEDGSNLAININLTPACNLKCVYCFAQGGDYGSLEKPMDVSIIDSLDYLIRKYKTR
jgi:sulfatase maturation enzyme AslB (radical SAM superfamily)